MATTELTISPLALESQELTALPPSRAEQIRAVFVPMANQLQEFEDEYNSVMTEAAEEVTPKVSKRARGLRLAIAKVRISTESARKEIKAEYLLASRAIDGVANVLKFGISGQEEALEAIEKHAERMEEERLGQVHAERMEALAPYVDEVPDRDFSAMEDDVWDAYLSTKKRDHEDRIEAERKAEADRAAEAEANARYIARTARVAPVFDFFPADLDIGTLPDAAFEALLVTAADAKAVHEAGQERVRAENARLAAEVARADKDRADERDRIAKQEKSEADAAAEKARAESEAAKAPTRDRLNAWVDAFTLPELPGDDHPTAADIRAKFDAFQAWARKQVGAV